MYLRDSLRSELILVPRGFFLRRAQSLVEPLHEEASNVVLILLLGSVLSAYASALYHRGIDGTAVVHKAAAALATIATTYCFACEDCPGRLD